MGPSESALAIQAVLVGAMIAALCPSSVTAQSPAYIEKYFDQVLDHFSYYNPTTFKQRYLYQDKWWNKESGPVFFYTGNEADITNFWANTGFVFELAPQFKALVIFCEHRYYGKSLPFGEKESFEHPNVDYLTVDQALADFAVFIDSFRSAHEIPDRPVIAFGGSYGGMLSAYMRFKYPNVIAGALAASAPIYLAVGLASRESYFEDVTKDFHDAAPGCDARVRQAFSKIYSLAHGGQAGQKTISDTFNLCSPLSKQSDLLQLVGWIRNALATMCMADYPYPTGFLSKLPAFPVKVACQTLLSNDDSLEGLAKAVQIFYHDKNCSDIWQDYVACSDPSGCGTGPTGLAWSYQACTDFIMPDGTNNKTDMFPYLPFSLQQRSDYCMKTWGIKTNEQWPKVSFFGRNIKSVSNIVFSNGNLDPWHRGGVLEDVSDTLVAVRIEGGAHHLDLRASNPADPESVIRARKIETSWIHKWLQDALQNKFHP